jgi:hypothetical protein
MLWQWVIVAVMVGVSAAYIAWRVWRLVQPGRTGSSCGGCHGCGPATGKPLVALELPVRNDGHGCTDAAP